MRLRYLIALLVALVIGSLAANNARAWGIVPGESHPVTTYRPLYNGGLTDPAFYTSYAAACQAGAAWLARINGSSCAQPPDTRYTAVCTLSQCSTTAWGVSKHTTGPNGYTEDSYSGGGMDYGSDAANDCPAGSFQEGSVCVCAKGSRPNSTNAPTGCVPYDCQPKGTFTQTQFPDYQVPTTDAHQCWAGCDVVPRSIYTAPDGKNYASWPYYFQGSGTQCGGPTAAAPGTAPSDVDTTGKSTGAEPPVSCAMGQCPGSVNGKFVCVACSATQTTTQTVDIPAPGASAPGATTETTTRCVNNACTETTTRSDGSSTTRVGSSGVNGSPGLPGGPNGNGTGTVVSSSGAASGAGAGDVKGGLDGWCAEHPDNGVCKDRHAQVVCQQGVDATTCSGEEIECQAVKLAAQTRCDEIYTPSAIEAQIEAMGGNGADTSKDQTISAGSGIPAVPVGACAVSDVSIPFGSGITASTLSFPIGTYVCPKLTVIKGVIVAFGSLLWVLIVAGFKGS